MNTYVKGRNLLHGKKELYYTSENYWLQNLRTDLKAGTEIRTLMSRYEEHRRAKDYEAVMDLIARANWEQMEVEKKMCDALNELFAEELKEADDKGRSRGREQLLRELIEKSGRKVKLYLKSRRSWKQMNRLCGNLCYSKL